MIARGPLSTLINTKCSVSRAQLIPLSGAPPPTAAGTPEPQAAPPAASDDLIGQSFPSVPPASDYELPSRLFNQAFVFPSLVSALFSPLAIALLLLFRPVSSPGQISGEPQRAGNTPQPSVLWSDIQRPLRPSTVNRRSSPNSMSCNSSRATPIDP